MAKRIRRGVSFALGFVLVLSLFPSLCFSQPATRAQERAVRDVDRDRREEIEEKMKVTPKPLPKPKEEEEKVKPMGPAIYVSKIDLTGTESFPPEEFRSVVEKYEGRDVTKVELDILTRAIQRAYLKRGVIAACFIPPQDVKEGVVVLRVVEAKMGGLEIADHDFFDKERLKNYWTIRPGKVLRYDTMSHDLQIMNANPDREVKATLHAGKKPQTTDVLLDVKTHFPVHVTASFDNEGARETGRERKGIGLRHNNFLLVDDMLMAGHTYGKHFSNSYFYHRVPITGFGTTVMYGYSYSRSTPKKDQEPLGMSSMSKNTSVFVYQDLYHKDDHIGDMHIGIDGKDRKLKTRTSTMYVDRFRMVRFGTKLICKAWGGVTHFTPELSQGVNAFGAKRKSPAIPDGTHPSSRITPRGWDDGVENTPTIFKMGVMHKRRFPLGLQGVFNFKSQVASQKLPASEEFFVGGMDSVRGYPAGDFLADTAFQMNMELLFPASFFLPEWVKVPYGARPLRDEITGLVFCDYAHAERQGVMDSQVATGEKRLVDFSSIGVGVRVRLLNQALLRLEWGYPIGGNRAISETAPSRLHLSIDFEDRLPREIARLQQEIENEEIKKRAWSLLNEEIRRSDSLLAAAMHDYRRLALAARERDDAEEARRHYEKIFTTGNSLFRQAESYVRDCRKKEKELKRLRKLALRRCSEGKLREARDLWQRIMDEAEIKPLELAF